MSNSESLSSSLQIYPLQTSRHITQTHADIHINHKIIQPPLTPNPASHILWSPPFDPFRSQRNLIFVAYQRVERATSPIDFLKDSEDDFRCETARTEWMGMERNEMMVNSYSIGSFPLSLRLAPVSCSSNIWVFLWNCLWWLFIYPVII
jgi:hypothetical protein